jgi:hypothetical protein
MMEKVTLYIRKILALILAGTVFAAASRLAIFNSEFATILLAAGCFLLFAFLDFRITGEKPRFLFGLNQSDTFLNKKGGFWNLFKWIVNLFGLAYDLLTWSLWGVFLLFVLFADLLLLIKTIVYWIIHALIWLLRQLFPPFVFLFKMILHYLVNWAWWIYQAAFRNMKISVNLNFFIIALWGTVPALFIVFLFYAIGQIAGVPQLALISVVFAIIPLVWSYGEIAALRFEQRERENHTAVRAAYRNGFDAVRSVLFYLLVALVLVVTTIIMNLLGWIPNISMSLLGISLNINMAISLLLIFLTVIIFFSASILPTHILYKPEHDNNLASSLGFLRVIARRFLRYTFSSVPSALFGSLLLVIPLLVMLLAFNITEKVKDNILQVRIEKLSGNANAMESLDAYRTDIKVKRLQRYQEVPLMAPVYFEELRNGAQLRSINDEIGQAGDQLEIRRAAFEKEVASINAEIERVKTLQVEGERSGGIAMLSSERLDLEEEYFKWEAHQRECIATMKADLQEMKRVRTQMPVLYLFVGVMFALFGGLVVAVLVAYLGNLSYELYNMRENGTSTYWCQAIREIGEKSPNQPLLGFTLLAMIGGLAWLLVYLL